MVSHHLAKFGSHSHCGSGDVMFLLVERQDCTCSRFNPPLLFICKRHGLKAHGISYRHWSDAFKATIGEKFENRCCQSVQKKRREGKLNWQLQSFLRFMQTQ